MLIPSLQDRVLIREGKKQRFGTHVYHENGLLVPYEIEDESILDELRSSAGEPPFQIYLETLRNLDLAIQNDDRAFLYRICFNIFNSFEKNAQDYLYFASFDEDEEPLKDENGCFLAFEDPCLASAFTLLITTPLNGDIRPEENSLSVILRPEKVDDTFILNETPIYLYLVEKSKFFDHVAYSKELKRKVFASREPIEVIAKFKSNSPIEALILTGGKIQICSGDLEYEFQDTAIREIVYTKAFFDNTLENEMLNQ